jgi:hypothetical protein
LVVPKTKAQNKCKSIGLKETATRHRPPPSGFPLDGGFIRQKGHPATALQQKPCSKSLQQKSCSKSLASAAGPFIVAQK